MNKGKALTKGAMIGITAPAGPVQPEKLQSAVMAVRKLGFRVEIGDTCHLNVRGYLAGSAQVRADELNRMFADSSIDGIYCLRGGYGSPQILPLLDYEMIKRNPKVFIGYSDITALHIALQQNSDLATIHGPMPASDVIVEDEYTKNSLLRTVGRKDPLGSLENPVGEPLDCLSPGRATGVLVGGNLSLIAAMMGTPFELNTKGKILFLEDVAEDVYKIDRMLTHLTLSNKLAETSGIMLGTWTDCGGIHERDKEYLLDLFHDIFSPLNKPVMLNVRAGHCSPMVSLPLGTMVELDTFSGNIDFKESVVK